VELPHPIEGHEQRVQSDHGENDGEVATIPDASQNKNEEDGAEEEEAAAVASAIGLPPNPFSPGGFGSWTPNRALPLYPARGLGSPQTPRLFGCLRHPVSSTFCSTPST